MNAIIKSKLDLDGFIRAILKADPSKIWVASFHEYRKPKTVRQLRLYFLWLRCVSEETGNDVRTIDLYFKDKYLGYEIKEFRGKEIQVPVSKADLTSQQMHRFLEAVRIEAIQEMQIHLPLPEEQGFDEFFEKYN